MVVVGGTVVVVAADEAGAEAEANPARLPTHAMVARVTLREILNDPVFFIICRRLNLEIIPIIACRKSKVCNISLARQQFVA